MVSPFHKVHSTTDVIAHKANSNVVRMKLPQLKDRTSRDVLVPPVNTAVAQMDKPKRKEATLMVAKTFQRHRKNRAVFRKMAAPVAISPLKTSLMSNMEHALGSGTVDAAVMIIDSKPSKNARAHANRLKERALACYRKSMVHVPDITRHSIMTRTGTCVRSSCMADVWVTTIDLKLSKLARNFVSLIRHYLLVINLLMKDRVMVVSRAGTLIRNRTLADSSTSADAKETRIDMLQKLLVTIIARPLAFTKRSALCQKQLVHVVDDRPDGIIQSLTKLACPSITLVVMVTKIISCLRKSVNNNVHQKSLKTFVPSPQNWVKDRIMKPAGTTTRKRNVAVNSITAEQVEMTTISTMNSLALHDANSSKQQRPHNDHDHDKSNGHKSVHNNLDVSKRNIASWTTIPVNVECPKPDTITTRTKDFATYSHTVAAEEMKTTSIRLRSVNNNAVMLKTFAVCHLCMDSVKIMQPVGTTIGDQRNASNLLSAAVVAIRTISTLKMNAEINVADEALQEMKEHRHPHILKLNQFARLQWNMVTVKTMFCPISTDQTLQPVKPSTTADAEAMAIALKPKNSVNASVDPTEELFVPMTMKMLLIMETRTRLYRTHASNTLMLAIA